MAHNRELLLAIILLGIAISIIIIKHIEIYSISFIGKRSRKFIIAYNILSVIQQISTELGLVLLSHYERIISFISIPYMFIAIYTLIHSILNIRWLLVEDEQNTNIITHIIKVAIKENIFGIPKIKMLIYNNKKIEFTVSHVDTKRINNLLKERAMVSKVHYYESSERLYGIELLSCQKL